MAKCDVTTFAQDPNIYWTYCPSQPAAILFATLYGLTLCCHFAQTIVYHQKNTLIITTGALLETVAFILRLVSMRMLDRYRVYEAQFILILIAPMFMNAFDFVLMGRLVNYCMPDRKLVGIAARRIAVVFICCDIGAFLVQLVGATMTISTNPQVINSGLHIYTAGVALQESFIFCFIGLAVVFRRRLRTECGPERAKRVQRLFWAICVSLALISFRIIFRIVEFSGDSNSKLSLGISNHEIYLYLFDCLPMIFALFVFNAVHPGRFLIGPDAAWPKKSRAEKAAEKQSKRQRKHESEQQKANDRVLGLSTVAAETMEMRISEGR